MALWLDHRPRASTTINYSNVQNLAVNGGGNDLFKVSSTAPFSSVTLTGGAQENTYAFVGGDTLGNVTIGTPDDGNLSDEHDKLDFSGLAPSTDGTGATIDLNSSDQPSVTDDGRLAITLTNPARFDTVIGTTGRDTILGNGRDNTLLGNGGGDDLVGGGGTDQMVGGDGDSSFILDQPDTDHNGNDGENTGLCATFSIWWQRQRFIDGQLAGWGRGGRRWPAHRDRQLGLQLWPNVDSQSCRQRWHVRAF